MSALVEALRRIGRDLDELPARWALIGGLAVSARAEPRLTRDVDIAVAAATDQEAENVVGRLSARGYRPQAVIEQEATGRLATVRLVPHGSSEDRTVVDLLFASSGIEAEIVAGAERLEIVPGLTLPVARLGHLVALKLLARDDRTRPQDAGDLAALTLRADPSDWADAAAAVELITRRGCARGRDLAGTLDVLQGGAR